MDQPPEVAVPDLADNFPRGVTDPFCSQGHVVETPMDRRMLWHLEMKLSGAPEYLRETASALRRYLNATCEHHWHESLTCCEPANDSCYPAHRQCLWCHDVEWLDGTTDR